MQSKQHAVNKTVLILQNVLLQLGNWKYKTFLWEKNTATAVLLGFINVNWKMKSRGSALGRDIKIKKTSLTISSNVNEKMHFLSKTV